MPPIRPQEGHSYSLELRDAAAPLALDFSDPVLGRVSPNATPDVLALCAQGQPCWLSSADSRRYIGPSGPLDSATVAQCTAPVGATCASLAATLPGIDAAAGGAAGGVLAVVGGLAAAAAALLLLGRFLFRDKGRMRRKARARSLERLMNLRNRFVTPGNKGELREHVGMSLYPPAQDEPISAAAAAARAAAHAAVLSPTGGPPPPRLVAERT